MAVINDFQVNSVFPSTVGGAGTAFYFPRLLGTSIGVESVAPSATSAAGQLVVNGLSELDGQWFDVLVGGYYKSGAADASGTYQLILKANTGTVTTPSYTAIAETAADAALLEATYYGFALAVSLYCSSKSGVLLGWQKSIMGATQLNAPTALTSGLTGIDMTAAAPFGLVVEILAGTSDAGFKAGLTQFQICKQ